MSNNHSITGNHVTLCDEFIPVVVGRNLGQFERARVVCSNCGSVRSEHSKSLYSSYSVFVDDMDGDVYTNLRTTISAIKHAFLNGAKRVNVKQN